MIKKEKAVNYILWILLICAYICNIFNSASFYETTLDSDMAAEMMLANLMNKHGDLLICKDWIYSTEIRILYTQPALQLGLLFFPNNWYYARLFSIALLTLVFILVFLHLCKMLKLKSLGLVMSIILISPISHYYFEMVGYSNAYIPHMLFYLLLTDLIVMYFNNKNNILIFLIVIIGIFGGTNGIRIMYNYALPLFTLSLILLFTYNKPKKIIDLIKNYIHNYFPILIALLSIFVGFLINFFYIRKVCIFADYTELVLQAPRLEFFISMVTHIFQLFGWQSISALKTKEGILSIFSLVIIGVLLISFIWYTKHLKKIKEDTIAYSIALSIPILFIELALVFSITNQNQVRYWIPTVPFLLIYIAYFIKNININNKYKQYIIALLLTSTLCTSISSIIKYDNYKVQGRKELVNYLVENNYSQGYSAFGIGNVATELSNGKLDIWVLDSVLSSQTTSEPLDWLQELRHLNEKPNGEIYFIVDIFDNNDEVNTDSIEEYKKYDKNGYAVYVFPEHSMLENFINNQK